MKALVTGGAGYVGSHMVRALLDAGHQVVVADDLSTGHRDAVPPEVRFVETDVGRTAEMSALLREEGIEAVFHFAAKSRVEESVLDPRLYFHGNIVTSVRLIDAVVEVAPKTPFVFSSTAAVYGNPETPLLDEDHHLRPVNPYGDTKLAIERALAAYGNAYGLPWTALRYFNAAGGWAEKGLGERHEPESHLIPIVLDVAEGKRPRVSIYGTKWPTPDGTCVRDYIHVRDLADAHLAAWDHLRKGGKSGSFNLGTGQGHSVREVVEAARAVTGRPIEAVDAPERAGDPASLVARVDRARQVLGWEARRKDLRGIVADAWAWKIRAKSE